MMVVVKEEKTGVSRLSAPEQRERLRASAGCVAGRHLRRYSAVCEGLQVG